MKSLQSYRLVIERRPRYAERLAAVSEHLSRFRPRSAIDWRERTEAWLRNFSGFVDQEIALGMLEKVRVISEEEAIEGCEALLAELRSNVKFGATLYHVAHEMSGTLLMRILAKELKVSSGEILRRSSFTRKGPMKRGDVIAIWDRMNGSGKELRTQLGMYKPLLDDLGKKPAALRFVYLAGYPLKGSLPERAFLHRWIKDIPVVTDEERDLCSRYLEAAGGTTAEEPYDAGALIAFHNNVPKDVPQVLCATGSIAWSPLLDRVVTTASRTWKTVRR